MLPAAAGALLFVAIFFGRGTSDSRLFWVGVASLLVVAAAVTVRPVRIGGTAAAFLAALAGLVVWQAATIAWSIQPARSWDYANRGIVYFTFGCLGVLLGNIPRQWVAAGLGALTTGVLAVALAAKVVPALYGDYGRLARLRWPLEYWNQLALLAAFTVPLGLWLAGRRDRPLRARVAGALHVYVASVAVVLTFSRFGIALAVAGAVVWVWLDRGRLDSLVALAVAAVPAAVAAGVGLALRGIADDRTSHATRARDGVIFGVVLVAGAVATAAGAWLTLGREPDVGHRQQLARWSGAALLGASLLGVVVLVVRAGGPADFVRVRWHEFSATQSLTGATRLGSASSGNRWAWWQQSWHAFTRHPGGGTGAGSFALTSTVSARDSSQSTIEPHSTPLQFLTETGIVGFLFYAAVVASVINGVVRERAGRATHVLALVAAIGWLHSLVDIDWSFVATQAPLFLVAGVLVSRPAEPAPRRVVAIAGVSAASIAAVYSLFSPWYAGQRLNDAFDAAERNDFAAARGAAQDAHSLNPLAIEPMQFLAAVDEPLGDVRGAEKLYDLATEREPLNPDTWYELGAFYVRHDRWREAYSALNRSYSLNRYASRSVLAALDRSRCAIDPVTCKATLVGRVPIPRSQLVRLASVARTVARRFGEQNPTGVAYVTTRSRFAVVSGAASPGDVIYALVLRGHFEPRAAQARDSYLRIALRPRTFDVAAAALGNRPPNTSRLGISNPLPLH